MVNATDIFQQSYERCMSVPSFMDLFYEKFLYSSDEVAKKFENTEFRRQKAMVASSLKMLMLSYQGDKAANEYLHHLATRHKELDVGPDLYELWLDSLLSTVEQTDPEFTREVEEAWLTVMRHGIDAMVSAYSSS